MGKLAVNISEIRNSGLEDKDFISYRATCACTDEHHSQTLHIENIEDTDMIELTIYSQLWYPDWIEKNPFKRFWRRLKVSTKLLFTGQIFLEGGFMFSGEDSIKDYVKALKEGLKKIDKSKHSDVY